MITIKQSGDYSRLTSYLERIKETFNLGILNKYGREGVKALSSVTPKDTGLTAASWSYKIEKTAKGIAISFHNTNIQNGVPIAIILQYGHATSGGGYVQGRDYINPVIRPLFDKIANEAWKEVTKV